MRTGFPTERVHEHSVRIRASTLQKLQPITRLFRGAAGAALLLAAAACSKSPESPTSPSGPGPSSVTLTAIVLAMAWPSVPAVVCAPFDLQCTNGTGWVQVLFRRLQANGTATLTNLGVPGSVLSPAIEHLGDASVAPIRVIS